MRRREKQASVITRGRMQSALAALKTRMQESRSNSFPNPMNVCIAVKGKL
jgi:hypothetical protein